MKIAIVPDFPSLPVQRVILRGLMDFVSLASHLLSYPKVLPTFKDNDLGHLLANLVDSEFKSAEDKYRQFTDLLNKKAPDESIRSPNLEENL